MPLARYITEFEELTIKEMIRRVSAGEYNKSQLESLLIHSEAASDVESVHEAIQAMLNHGELPLTETAVAVVDEPAKLHSVHISGKLDQAAHLINHRYEILTKPARAASRAVIEIGVIMLAVKEELPHGDLKKWRDENTNLSERWDIYCRKAAQKFIDDHGRGTAMALIEGSGSNQRQVEQAEQLLMQFTGGKGPSALLHDLGIKKTEKAPPPELPDGESGEHYNAVQTWNHIAGLINNHGLTQESWADLNSKEQEALYDIVNELATRLRALIKKGAKS